MANELTVNVSLNFSKGLINEPYSPTTSVTVAGSDFVKCRQDIATSDTVITFPSIASNGYVALRNLDTVGGIGLGFDGVDYMIVLGPGELALFRLGAGVTLHAIADPSPCSIQVFMVGA